MPANSRPSPRLGLPDNLPLPSALNPLDAVSGHPRWYFSEGKFDVNELVARLVDEAMRAGAQCVQVRREGDWISVSADQDWLQGDLTPFYAPVSYPEGGPNSSRVEVALTAFCDAVITDDGRDHYFEVKSWSEGQAPITEALLPPDIRRMVAFLPPRKGG